MKTSQIYLILISVGALLFIPNLGLTHLFDWDEINFAECAREMIVSHNYWQVQIDFKPFWEKPPFFIWMQVLSMKLWGINEIGARFPNAIIGISTLVILFYVGKRLRNKQFALLWAAFYAISILPHLYFKSGIIDPTFNLFIFLSIFFYSSSMHRGRKKYYASLSGISLGLAFITKGPVALLIFGGTFLLFFLFIRAWKKLQIQHLGIILLGFLVVSSLWVLPNYFLGGKELFTDFIQYQWRLLTTQDAGHGGPFYYHFIVLLFGCFPSSVFLFQKNKLKVQINSGERDFYSLMIILLSFTLVVFSLVETKIVHYSSLCYFPLSYLAAHNFYNLWIKNNKSNRLFRYFYLFIGSTTSLIIIIIPLIMSNIESIKPFIHDQFAKLNLNAEVSWSWTDSIPGIILFTSTLLTFHGFTHRRYIQSFLICSLGLILSIQLLLVNFPSKIEAISQGAAIEFISEYKEYQIDPIGYKSYAHLFYGERKPSYDKTLPTFHLMKYPTYEKKENKGDLKFIKDKNGYVLLKSK